MLQRRASKLESIAPLNVLTSNVMSSNVPERSGGENIRRAESIIKERSASVVAPPGMELVRRPSVLKLFERKSSRALTKIPESMSISKKLLTANYKPQNESDSSSDDDHTKDIYASPLLRKKKKEPKGEKAKLNLKPIPLSENANGELELDAKTDTTLNFSPVGRRKTLLNNLLNIMRRNSIDEEAIANNADSNLPVTNLRRLQDLGHEALIPFLSSHLPKQHFLELVEMDDLDLRFYYTDKWPLLSYRKPLLINLSFISKICQKITKHSVFESLSLCVIILNSIFLMMDDPTQKSSDSLADNSEYYFLGIYTAEAVMKIFSMGFLFNKGAYLRDAWNILDFVIIVSGYIPFILDSSLNLSVLRAFRVLRPLKTISTIKELKILLGSLIAALPLLKDTIIILMFFYTIFAIAGLQLFMGVLKKRCINMVDGKKGYFNGGVESYCSSDDTCGVLGPQFICAKMLSNPNWNFMNFDNFLWAYLQIFQVCTLEGWSSMMIRIQITYSQFVWLFFIPLSFVGAFFLINLMLAVIKVKFSETENNKATIESKLKNLGKVMSYSVETLVNWEIYKRNRSRKVEERHSYVVSKKKFMLLLLKVNKFIYVDASDTKRNFFSRLGTIMSIGKSLKKGVKNSKRKISASPFTNGEEGNKLLTTGQNQRSPKEEYQLKTSFEEKPTSSSPKNSEIPAPPTIKFSQNQENANSVLTKMLGMMDSKREVFKVLKGERNQTNFYIEVNGNNEVEVEPKLELSVKNLSMTKSIKIFPFNGMVGVTNHKQEELLDNSIDLKGTPLHSDFDQMNVEDSFNKDSSNNNPFGKHGRKIDIGYRDMRGKKKQILNFDKNLEFPEMDHPSIIISSRKVSDFKLLEDCINISSSLKSSKKLSRPPSSKPANKITQNSKEMKEFDDDLLDILENYKEVKSVSPLRLPHRRYTITEDEDFNFDDDVPKKKKLQLPRARQQKISEVNTAGRKQTFLFKSEQEKKENRIFSSKIKTLSNNHENKFQAMIPQRTSMMGNLDIDIPNINMPVDDNSNLIQYLTKEEKQKLFKKWDLGAEFNPFLEQLQEDDEDDELINLNIEQTKKELRSKHFKLVLCESKEFQAYSLDDVLPSMCE